MNASFPDTAQATDLLPLRLLIAAPRGFCAGVDRAIEIVERAIANSARPSMCGTRSSITAMWSTV
jgi:4-hydroxy-3-methylbut-2-enyl diphosphate reductase